jgi:nucleotide-binding universal stress UspA family protein
MVVGFKTILLNLNHEARVPQLTAAAAALARSSEAHVIGLYVMPPIFAPSDVTIALEPDFYEDQIQAIRDQADRTKVVFERLTRGEPFAVEWRVHGDGRRSVNRIADGIIADARACDLVIASQATGPDLPPLFDDVPQRLALESGRPVLVIPTGWSACDYGRTIAVAWNDSREATRAVFDALPLLEKAESVRLVTVCEETKGRRANAVPAAEVAATLARHGLNIEVETIAAQDRNTGRGLLARVKASGADLLVMGAYGHSRLREFMLGGATREILSEMTVPVLLSH